MEKKCPSLLVLNESSVYTFQCNSDQVNPSTEYTWTLNKERIENGVERQQYRTEISQPKFPTVDGTELTILVRLGDESISCSLGNTSEMILFHGKLLLFLEQSCGF